MFFVFAGTIFCPVPVTPGPTTANPLFEDFLAMGYPEVHTVGMPQSRNAKLASINGEPVHRGPLFDLVMKGLPELFSIDHFITDQPLQLLASEDPNPNLPCRSPPLNYR